MLNERIIPTKQGQIVKILNPLPNEDPNEAYLLAQDPSPYDDGKLLLLYSITEFLRCQAIGTTLFANQVQKKDLTVVGENLEMWVDSWNHL